MKHYIVVHKHSPVSVSIKRIHSPNNSAFRVHIDMLIIAPPRNNLFLNHDVNVNNAPQIFIRRYNKNLKDNFFLLFLYANMMHIHTHMYQTCKCSYVVLNFSLQELQAGPNTFLFKRNFSLTVLHLWLCLTFFHTLILTVCITSPISLIFSLSLLLK